MKMKQVCLGPQSCPRSRWQMKVNASAEVESNNASTDNMYNAVVGTICKNTLSFGEEPFILQTTRRQKKYIFHG